MRPLPELDELLDRSNKAGIQFVTIEMAIASTLLDRADATSDSEASRQSRQRARVALDAASSILPRLRLSPEEHSALREGLRQASDRLQHCGAAEDSPPGSRGHQLEMKARRI